MIFVNKLNSHYELKDILDSDNLDYLIVGKLMCIISWFRGDWGPMSHLKKWNIAVAASWQVVVKSKCYLWQLMGYNFHAFFYFSISTQRLHSGGKIIFLLSKVKFLQFAFFVLYSKWLMNRKYKPVIWHKWYVTCILKTKIFECLRMVSKN